MYLVIIPTGNANKYSGDPIVGVELGFKGICLYDSGLKIGIYKTTLMGIEWGFSMILTEHVSKQQCGVCRFV